MAIAILQLLIGIGLLYLGGELLVRSSVTLAARLGIRPLIAGLTIVAFGTSAPELAVTLDAALEGYNDVAVGSVVGSNICNIALILGLAALISPMRVDPQLFRFDIPVMILSTLLMMALLLDGGLGRVEGAVLFLALLGYVWIQLRLAFARGDPSDPAEGAAPRAPRYRAWLLAPTIVGALGVLAGGGYLVVHGGVEVAAALGVSNAVIALTVVAVGTSLPELSTSLVAAIRRHSDIALGNVVGTNVFNILGILGLTAVVQPLQRGGVSWWDLGAMALAAMALVPLARTGLHLGRAEGAALLAGYTGYCGWRLLS